MRFILAAAATAYFSSVASGQDLVATAADLQNNGLSPLETLALESFAADWDSVAQNQFPNYFDSARTIDLKQGWQGLRSGLQQLSQDLQYGNIDQDAWRQDMQQVLSAANRNWSVMAQLSSDELARLFVAAQALKISAVQQTGGEVKYCIFIIYCSNDDPWR